jgi:aminoglycoside phosphotransferase (APT) family kinase protein
VLDDPDVTIPEPERAALAKLLPRYLDGCARLAGTDPGPSLNHDDLHSGNVLPGPVTDRFFDWGDASLASPLTSLLVALRSMAHTFDLPRGDRLLLRLRDAYLEPWALGPDGRDLAELAMWTGALGRALAWRRALVAATPAERRELDDPVGAWTRLLLTVPWEL